MSELKEHLKFGIKAEWDGKTGAEVRTEAGKIFSIDTPTEFGGYGRAPCPDELFLTSIAGCVLTTFLWFTRKRGVEISEVRLDAESEVELVKGAYSLKAIRVKVEVRAPEQHVSAARKCLDLAIRYCHISRSIEQCVRVEVLGEVLSR
ncbi:MAG: hypothetical protein DRO05_07055 [Thermoproteota archaeon]|nr:MAG: hypothetical protein DRO05_07055 [Candidatus Korarchaeota archaeon]